MTHQTRRARGPAPRLAGLTAGLLLSTGLWLSGCGNSGRQEAVQLSVTFTPQATEEQIQQVVQIVDGRIVEGPTPERRYGILLTPRREAGVDSAVTALRMLPWVSHVERAP